MPRNKEIKKVLVIGSGPIVIGQAAEFDYAGTQACRALKEDGLEVVLVNSNPATIMTDNAVADRIYIEPLTLTTVKRIIEKERPDSLLSTLGGQTGLTLSMQLAKEGFLEKMNVTLLGADPETIDRAEDRLAGENVPFVKKLVRAGFAMRRKTLVNNLCSALSLPREKAEAAVVAAGFSPMVRGETLSLEDYVALAHSVSGVTDGTI